MKLVLFDIDGTLITSRGAGRRALDRALRRAYGTAGALESYDLRGRTDLRIVFDVLEAAGLERERVKAGLGDCFEEYVRALVEEIGDGSGVVTLPGVADLVARLGQAEAVVLGLLTGNIEEGARIKLLPTGLWPQFRLGAYGSDHADRRLLPSLAARRAQALLGRAFAPRDVLVIGDTPWDVDCARAFGAVSVAVATGNYGRDELLAEGPDLFFESFADVDAAARALLCP
ncbi:MAG: haloacid dehalogenase-like hydrolase [Candidatus Rokubacteria bacterium]|nr:haloacid dehalogenase-like hydrolase [Candidatus Rokubacteria bacterium]